MKDHPHILAIAGDPGGAAAIAPVLSELIIRSGPDCLTVLAYREAIGVFRRSGIPFCEVDESTDAETFHDQLIESQPHLILTSTSVNGIDLELKLLAASSQLNIPSLSVLDFWSNYRRRFENSAGCLQLPTRIAVMDENAIHAMVRVGFPREILVATGQPAFDRLTDWTPVRKAATRASVRGQLNISESTTLIVFMSQPLEEFYRQFPVNERPCYNEKTVFARILPLLSTVAAGGRSLQIMIKPHPRERRESWSDLKATEVPVSVNGEIPSADLALAADLVLGMTSVVLLECSLLGRPVVSIQPETTQCENVFRDFPAIASCLRDQDLPDLLYGQLMTSTATLPAPVMETATPQVLAELQKLVDSKSTREGGR